MKSTDCPERDAQVRNEWSKKSRERNGYAGSPEEIAVKLVCLCTTSS